MSKFFKPEDFNKSIDEIAKVLKTVKDTGDIAICSSLLLIAKILFDMDKSK